MATMKRFQLELTEREHDELELLMAHAGIKTKREIVSNALALFRWAALETLHGKQIASATPDGKVVKQLEMPSLAAFVRHAEAFNKLLPSREEVLNRATQPGESFDEVLAEIDRDTKEFRTNGRSKKGRKALARR